VRDLYCWGRNQVGQAGNGTTAVSSIPVRADAAPKFERLFGHSEHVCAFDTERRLFCWGRNDFGQLGDGTVTPATTPIAVATTRTYADAAAGVYLTCGLRVSGAVDCWGYLLPGPPQP
jgi:alpha-tubulin suppressor-like RCC1 family protein